MQPASGKHRSRIVTQLPLVPVTEGRTAPAPENVTQPKSVALKPSADTESQPGVSLVEALSRSTVYREYVHAFSETTGLVVALRPVQSWQPPLRGKRHESPFCALMSERSRVCACCLQMQERLAQGEVSEPITIVCSSGSCETAVPVRLGSQLIGFLQTGQVFRSKPTTDQFERTTKALTKLGVKLDLDQLKHAYFATRVMPKKQQEAATTLLKIFAQHLSAVSNQVIMQPPKAEPDVIAKAKAYIEEHQAENIRLEQVAQAVNTNRFHFCKLFKKATGINYTDYLSRIRIEKAKNLLLNPNLRISEIAFEVGFQSITHFNRVFSKVFGQSPTDYRSQLMPALRPSF
jgi:AraC-like DNA-binding protein/ligand-binding sensor protein